MTSPSMKLLAAKNGVPTFSSPLDLSWAHAYWAEGPEFQALGLSGGGTVITWPDEAGTSDATRVNALAGPSYRTSAIGARPSVRFDGSAQRMQTSAWTTITQPWSLVAIYSSGDAQGYMTDGLASTNRSLMGHSSSNHLFYAGASLLFGSVTSSPHLVVGVANGASSAVEKDGTLQTGNAGSHGQAGLTIGADYTGGDNLLMGDIAFIGIVSGDIRTDPLWPDFEAWVTDHYGITIA